jgi:hypothetical protein
MSDEGASNVNPRERNLVTTRVMYYIFLRPVVLDCFYDRNDLCKISIFLRPLLSYNSNALF